MKLFIYFIVFDFTKLTKCSEQIDPLLLEGKLSVDDTQELV